MNLFINFRYIVALLQFFAPAFLIIAYIVGSIFLGYYLAQKSYQIVYYINFAFLIFLYPYFRSAIIENFPQLKHYKKKKINN